jgi:hypothetical protein
MVHPTAQTAGSGILLDGKSQKIATQYNRHECKPRQARSPEAVGELEASRVAVSKCSKLQHPDCSGAPAEARRFGAVPAAQLDRCELSCTAGARGYQEWNVDAKSNSISPFKLICCPSRNLER